MLAAYVYAVVFSILQLYVSTVLVLNSFRDGDPLELLQAIIPDVQDQVIWMANALEVFHCVHQVLHQRGADVSQLTSTPPSSLPTDGAEAVEAISLLQEVIVYSFQQVLYPATRVS